MDNECLKISVKAVEKEEEAIYYRIAGPSPGLHISQKDEKKWNDMRSWAEGEAVRLLEFDKENCSLCTCQFLDKENFSISRVWVPYCWLAPMPVIVIEAPQLFLRHDADGCFVLDCKEKTVNGR